MLPGSHRVLAISILSRYHCPMSRFKNVLTERLANDEAVRELPKDLHVRASMRIAQVLAAERLEDLRNPPGNRLKALGGDRKGTFSIRINDQWRICFRWTDRGAGDIEVVDYH